MMFNKAVKIPVAQGSEIQVEAKIEDILAS
jgi:hypothetical protein